MSKPILYAPEETNFMHNGIGILNDCTYCMVTEEINGQFELEMRYPIDGIHGSEISDRCIIKAPPNVGSDPQLFRVYAISRPMNGIISVYAAHISYDLSGIPVSPFSVSMDGSENVLSILKEKAAIYCPFNFSTEFIYSLKLEVPTPRSIRSVLLDSDEKGILGTLGGEYEFNNFDVILRPFRGAKIGASIRYGKNLRNIKQEKNTDLVYSGIYPFWFDSESKSLVELDEKIILVQPVPPAIPDGNVIPEDAIPGYGIPNYPEMSELRGMKIKTLDLTSSFSKKPTKEQLLGAAQLYLSANAINVPSVSLSISYLQTKESEFFSNLNLLEGIYLGDEVSIEFPALGVSTKARAIEVEYNVILDRVENVVFGKKKATLLDSIVALS